MLNALAALLAAAFQAPSEQAPQLPDHRTQFTINPLELTSTGEWTCAKDGSAARWTIKTRDISAPNRNEIFESELVELMLGGRPVDARIQDRVKATLGDFNRVPVISGECIGRSPIILLTGFRRVDNQYRPLRLEIRLKNDD